MTQPELYPTGCAHTSRENRYNQGGDPIAVACSTCTAILAYHGACKGCNERQPLYAGTGRQEKRFCETSCFDRWKKRQAKERRLAAKAATKK